MPTNSTAQQTRIAELTFDELDAVAHIDRTETIVGFYRVERGELIGDDLVHESPNWSETRRQEYIERSRTVLNSGGSAIGGWEGDRLVGFALIDPHGAPSHPTLVQLDLFHVSARHRGRGIARLLLDAVVTLARNQNAEGVYISATPSRNTVDVYRHFGARLCLQPDPALLGQEPDDIHLVLWLSDYQATAGSERAG